ncbi:MAG: hypothetical protein CM15mP120_20340 [Pseudomonadota bacterium]|nr:MAG: hypothetical protein CM15mP120_20340 [Pseudomonadota bacterium]
MSTDQRPLAGLRVLDLRMCWRGLLPPESLQTWAPT